MQRMVERPLPIAVDRVDVRATLAKLRRQRGIASLRRVVQRGGAARVRLVDQVRVGGKDPHGLVVVLQQRTAREVGNAATFAHRPHRIRVPPRPPGIAVQGHLAEERVGVGGVHATPVRRLDNGEHIVRFAALDGLCEPGCYVGHRP